MFKNEQMIQKDYEKDLRYIAEEIIAQQPKENLWAEEIDDRYKYVKFSRALNAVTVINLTRRQFKNYWRTIYKNDPEKWKEIEKAINEKFENGLTSTKDMIEMIKKSKDFESEKKAAIKALTSKTKKAENKTGDEELWIMI